MYLHILYRSEFETVADNAVVDIGLVEVVTADCSQVSMVRDFQTTFALVSSHQSHI